LPCTIGTVLKVLSGHTNLEMLLGYNKLEARQVFL